MAWRVDFLELLDKPNLIPPIFPHRRLAASGGRPAVITRSDRRPIPLAVGKSAGTRGRLLAIAVRLASSSVTSRLPWGRAWRSTAPLASGLDAFGDRDWDSNRGKFHALATYKKAPSSLVVAGCAPLVSLQAFQPSRCLGRLPPPSLQFFFSSC